MNTNYLPEKICFISLVNFSQTKIFRTKTIQKQANELFGVLGFWGDRITAQDLYQPKEWDGHEFLYSFGPPPPPEFVEPADLADLIAGG